MARTAMRRAFWFVVHLLAGSLLLVALIAAGLWWWSGTEGSLEWLLKRIGQSQPLEAEGVTGSLRSGLRVQRLAWEREGLRVEAYDVLLEWAPTALVTRTVQLDELRARLVRVIDERPKDAEPMQPPQGLGLPMRVRAGDVKIGRIEYDGAADVQLGELAAGYAFDGLQHELRLDQLHFASGRYRGEATLGAIGEMPLRTTLQGTLTTSVPGSTATVPLTLQAQAEGPLADFRAEALLASQAAAGGTTPRATVTARVTPFAPQPLPQAQAQLRGIDLAALWPQAPRSLLSGDVSVQPAAGEAWDWRAELRNGAAGPWDESRLPVERLQAQGQWRGGAARVESLQAELGGGTASAQGRWRSAEAWTVEAKIEGVNPAALHSAFAAQAVGGTAIITQAAQGIDFEAALQAQGRAPRRAAEGADLAATIAQLQLREARARGRWSEGMLALPLLDVRTSDATLDGNVTLTLDTWAGDGRLRLQAPGLVATAEGRIDERAGAGDLRVQASELARARRWAAGLPVVGESLQGWLAEGSANLQLAWRGGWRDPALQARLATARLQLREADAPQAAAWTVQDAQATVDGRLTNARFELGARAEQGARKLRLQAAGRGGRRELRQGALWHAQLPQLALAAELPEVSAGSWELALRDPLELRWSTQAGRLEVGAAQAVLQAPAQAALSPGAREAVISWQPSVWGGGALRSAGQITGLPMAWLSLLGQGQMAGAGLTGNLVFDGQWNVSTEGALRLDAALARRSGDVNVLAETAQGSSTRVAAGVREARLSLEARGDNLTATLRWSSERAGTADARLVTKLQPGGPAGWHWPEQAPLGGFVRAQLPRIGVWSLLAPPGWRLRGSLSADLALGGTRADPRLVGTLSADDLALRSVVEGVELQDGRLRARVEGQRVRVDEFVLRGGGSDGGSGTLVAYGEGQWTGEGLVLDATATLSQLRASIRSDRDITLSGQLQARVAPEGTKVTGRLVVDRARIQLPDETPPRLGADVVVRRAEGRIATAQQRREREPERPPPKRPLDVAVEVDLGKDFQLRGRGLDTELQGQLKLAAESISEPRLTGTVRTVGGEYRAYGRQLEIERGVLRFTGPVANPVLDVLAVRPRLAQTVGVQITGTAQAPVVRLYSEPDMPDAEKLNWLITGRAAPSSGAEAALVQQAALALLMQRRGGTDGGIAGRVGLDELSVRRDDTAGAVVTLGKRFADNFYASYERSLSGALGTLYIFYELTERLTLRAQAGEGTALDLIYTFSFDGLRR